MTKYGFSEQAFGKLCFLKSLMVITLLEFDKLKNSFKKTHFYFMKLMWFIFFYFKMSKFDFINVASVSDVSEINLLREKWGWLGTLVSDPEELKIHQDE